MADVLTPPAAHTASATVVELDIPCECAHSGRGCDRPAELWVVMHDVCGDCRSHDDGVSSEYLCHGCWDPLAAELAFKLRLSASQPAMVLRCDTCHAHFHRWSDLVFRVVPIQGTKR